MGTCVLVHGSATGTGQKGHVSDCTMRGDVYWYGSTYGFRFIGQVSTFVVREIDVNGGITDIKEDERSSGSTDLAFYNVKFHSASWGDGGKIISDCPGYRTENWGSDTLAGSTNTDTFNHGLAGTPTHVTISWKEDIGDKPWCGLQLQIK